MNQARLSAIRDRAKRLHAEGRLADALAAHDEALTLAPDAVGIRLSAATLAHALGLPNISLAHFERADVVLDSVHFNGMNSSLECFAMGTPVVTLPTRLQRGRHTQAMYRAMGILDCIAADAADYAQIAVRIATNPAHRHALRERILAANHVLFENQRVVAEFERLFVEAAARATALVPDTSRQRSQQVRVHPVEDPRPVPGLRLPEEPH